MAKSLNTFVKSKMNRDLDARLVPKGEYREGRNINISKSEGSDVGALENIRGNEEIIKEFINSLQDAQGFNNPLEIIGFFKHDETSSLYLFLTSWVDNSPDRLSRGYEGFNYIVRISVLNRIYTPKLLVKGSFLNFSKNSPILGFNIIENQLYWSDNRNQPRKINIDLANCTGSTNTEPTHLTDYYYTEDQISVAKFAPYEPIRFVKNIGDLTSEEWVETWVNESEEFLPPFLTIPLSANTQNTAGDDVLQFGSKDGYTNDKSRFSGRVKDYISKGFNFSFPKVRIRNRDVPNGGTRYLWDVQEDTGTGNDAVRVSTSLSNNSAASPGDVPTTWSAGDLITFELTNPQYNSDKKTEYLKDKFVRFSYRFKYSDNEYSLMAPFTQPLFVPKQYGAFTEGDEAKAAINTDLAWFENLITSADLIIQLPELTYESSNVTNLEFTNRYKVKEIQILIKTSNDNNVYSIDSIPLIPENFDRTSSLSMLVSNNYPNSMDPTTGGWPYNSQFVYKYKGNEPFQVLPERDVTRVSDSTPVRSLSQEVAGNRLMYGNYQNSHGAPKSLNYECFVTPKNFNFTSTNSPPIPVTDDTLVREYYSGTLKQGRTYQVGVVLSDRYGRQSNVILAENNAPGAVDRDKSTVYAPYGLGIHPGVNEYFGDSLKVSFEEKIPESITGVNFYPGLYNKDTNPLGWYSYKIVVKQTEQEYYNVYLPGALSGNVLYTKPTEVLNYTDIYEVSNISLFGDNINKIPKVTTNLSATDTIFNSETSLTYRVAQYSYDANNVTNNQIVSVPVSLQVTNIQQWKEFGPWTGNKGTQLAYGGGNTSGTNDVDPIYNADKNPFIATIDIGPNNFRIGFPAAGNSGQGGGRFSRFLMVAETNPTKSNLDIYWETSTSGLISDLNTAIENGETLTGVRGVSPFLWQFQEQYPYDGIGAYNANYPPTLGDGAYLLQSDLKVLQNNGSVNTSASTTLTLTNVTSSSDPTSENLVNFFELVQTKTSGVGGAGQNEWNIKLADSSSSNEAYVDNGTNIQFPLQGNLTFEFIAASTSGTPLTRTVSFSNNLLTNNEPKWNYINQDTWGSAKNDPTNVNNVLDGSADGEHNAAYIDASLILANKKVLMSPFIPLNKSQTYANSGRSTYWSKNLEWGWSMSIKGSTNAGSTWGNSGSNNIGKLFEKVSGDWRVFSSTGLDNSGVRMNKIIASNSGYAGTVPIQQVGWDFNFNNGSFANASSNTIPYIRRCELAVFDNNDSWDNWAPTGIGDQGAVPRSSPTGAWKDFLIVGTQADGNGPHPNYDLAGFGYWKFPFDIAIPNSSNNPQGDSSNETNKYCLLVDLNNPPFCQFDEWDNGDFDPRGNLGDRDICVYRLTIGLKEQWSGGLTQTTEEQVVYIKLYK